MDTNEFFRIQGAVNVVHLFTNKMSFLADMETYVVATGFYPFDRISIDNDISTTNACHKSLDVIHDDRFRVVSHIQCETRSI